MPETLNINKLQIKTTTATDADSSHTLAKGEPCYVEGVTIVPNVTNITVIVVGDGSNKTPSQYISGGMYFVPKSAIESLIPTAPTSGGENSNTVRSDGTAGSNGTSTQYARANHTHKLDIKISSGTIDPTDPTIEPIAGSDGDIYIKYEEESSI